MFARKLVCRNTCRPTLSENAQRSLVWVSREQSFVCDFTIALEIMESMLTCNDDNFCKFLPCAQLPYSTHARCTGDSRALENRR